MMLRMIEASDNTYVTLTLAGHFAALGPTPAERARVRAALLSELVHGQYSRPLDELVVRLAVTAQERIATSKALLAMSTQHNLARVLPVFKQLHPAEEDKREARRQLVEILDRESSPFPARSIMDQLADLDPTIRDLDTSTSWAARPNTTLLAAVRSRCTLTEWLDLLASVA
jgi:hypothetical protein